MSGNNMESLLMGDDSSSGESDGEEQVNVPAGGTAASAVAAMPAPAPAPPPQQAAPSPAPAPSGGGSSQLDQMARLKSLYQNQPKRTGTPSSGASTPQSNNLSAPAPQQQMQPPPQHQAAPSTAVRPLMPNRPHTMPQQQQPHVQQQPPHYQQQQQYQQPRPSSTAVQGGGVMGHRGSSSSAPSGTTPMGVPDPFAPTPLHRIKERHQQQQQRQPPPHQQQQLPPQQQPQYHRPQQPPPQQPPQQQVLPGGPAPVSVSTQDRAAMERELRRQKEKFLMFTRVLIKYLEQKDPKMHQDAKLIIKDCAERNKRLEPGYESVTAAMKSRLKALVGDNYWKRAEAYLKHFLEQKKAASAGAGGSSSANNAAMDSASGATAVSGASSSNAARSAQQQQQAQQQRLAQEKQRKMQQAKAAKQQQQQQQQQQVQQQQQQASGASSSAAPGAAPTLQQVQQDIAKQKAKLTTGGKGVGGKGASVGKKQVKRKSSTGASSARKSTSGASSPSGAATPTAAAVQKAAAVAAAVAAIAVDPETLPPREYNDLMELVDHAIDYDWTTAGLLLGSSKADLQLTEEQHKLLYGETTAKPPDEPPVSGPRPGWGTRNVVSARTAWAIVRLREHKHRSSQQQAPVVGDAGLTLPQTPGTLGSTASSAGTKVAEEQDTSWVNEEKAEQDATLAILSEGTEIFLKGVLEKAIQSARQRQNLDGIRLWHQQFLKNNNKKKKNSEANGKGDNGNDDEKNNDSKPALSLRMGCDVERQQAQAAGNAAMTVKRMEQALERQSGVPARARVLQGETLDEATSMADLALRPQLANGAETADYHGKRRFEVYGGKDAAEPPLGRVPKKAMLEVIDVMMGSNVTEPIGRHRASNAATSIYF